MPNVAYLPHSQPANGSTSQMRRRVTDLVNSQNYSLGQLADVQSKIAQGVTGTITLASLTVGGTEGSITVTDGLITAFTNPT